MFVGDAMVKCELKVGDRVRIKRARRPNSNWDDFVGKVDQIIHIGGIVAVRVYNPNFEMNNDGDPTWGFNHTSLEKF